VRSDQPPRIANWLLRTFGYSPNNDAVIGDLNESYRQGRSRRWYWQQVIAAIISSAFTEVRSHKFIAVRAVILGLILLHAIGKLMFNLFGRLLAVSLHARFANEALFYEGPLFSWIFLSLSIFIFIIGIWSGWMVARFHKGQHAMVLLYGVATLLWLLGFAIIEGIDKSPLSGPRHSLSLYCVNSAILFAGIALGGSFCRSSRPDATPPQRVAS
jgi:hypothetical protein